MVIAIELRTLTEVLGNAYEKLKQLALKASCEEDNLFCLIFLPRSINITWKSFRGTGA